MMRNWRSQLLTLFLLVITIIGGVGSVRAAQPTNIVTYQGRVLSSTGVPVGSSSVNMRFWLYDASVGGTCVWSNSSSTCDSNTPASATTRSVSLSQGLFTENLGDTADAAPYAAIPDTVFGDNTSIYLAVEIGGETLSPRKRMTAAPYALNAQRLDGLDSTAFLAADGDTATGDYDFTGAELTGASPFVFEGLTNDGFTTTFTITNPTGANTITFQDASGTVAYTSDLPDTSGLLSDSGDTATGAYDFTGAVFGGASPLVFEGGTGNTFESTFAFTDPTADRTITFQDASGTVAYSSDITTEISNAGHLSDSGDTATGAYDFTGATFGGSSAIVFEGATANLNETTFAITDPTADRTVTVPDASGTLALTSDLSNYLSDSGDTATGAYDFTGAVFGGASPLVFEGGTGNTFESTFAFTDPTADRTITFQDASGTVAYSSDITTEISNAGHLSDSGDTATGAYDFTGATFGGSSAIVFEGATANLNETTFAITDPTADRTITFKDSSGTVAFTSDFLWQTGANGTYEDGAAVIVGADALFSYAGGGIGDLRVASELETVSDGYIGGNLVIGASTSATETVADTAFVMGGDDLFVAGMVGTEGAIYTDSKLVVNSSTELSYGQLSHTGTLTIDAAGGAGTVQLGVDDDLLPQLGASTATLGSSGVRWDAVYATTGDFAGTVTVNDLSCTDCLDFTELSDTLALDASTSITMDSTEALTINNTGTGAFAIQDGGSDVFSIDGTGNVAYTLDATDNPSYTLTNSGSSNVTFNMAGTGDFDIQDGGSSRLKVNDDGTLHFVTSATTTMLGGFAFNADTLTSGIGLGISADGLTSGIGFVANSSSPSLASGKVGYVLEDPTYTTTTTRNGATLGIGRQITVNGVGANVTATGPVLSVFSDPTVTTGTLTDEASLISATQLNTSATGDAISIANDGTGSGISITQDGEGSGLSVTGSVAGSALVNITNSTEFTDDTGLALNIDVEETGATADIFKITTDANANDTEVFRIEADGGFTSAGTATVNDLSCTDCLDFTELSDTLALDASTSITLNGAEDLSINNTGTGSFSVLENSEPVFSIGDTGTIYFEQIASQNPDFFVANKGSGHSVFSLEGTGNFYIFDGDPNSGGTPVVSVGDNGHHNYTTLLTTTGTAFEFDGSTLTSGNGLALSLNGLTTGDGFKVDSGSGDLTGGILGTFIERGTYTTSATRSGQTLSLERSITVNNAAAAVTTSGALLDINNNPTVTSGSLTDTASLINATQNNSTATGDVISLGNAGLGSGIILNQTNTASTSAAIAITNAGAGAGATVSQTGSSGSALSLSGSTSTDPTLYIRQNANGQAINALSSATTSTDSAFVFGSSGTEAPAFLLSATSDFSNDVGQAMKIHTVETTASSDILSIFSSVPSANTEIFLVEADGDITTTGGLSASGTISTTGTVSANDFSCTDCLDFTELSDSLALDASTTITLDTAENLTINNTGTGSFQVQEAGTTVFSVADTGDVSFEQISSQNADFTVTNNGTGTTEFWMDGTGAFNIWDGLPTGPGQVLTISDGGNFNIVNGQATGNGFRIVSPFLTTGNGFLAETTSASLSSGTVGDFSESQVYNTTTTRSGTTLTVDRSFSVNDAAAAITSSGSLLKVTNNPSVTTGSITDSATLLDLVQSNTSSTGDVLTISNQGSGLAALIDTEQTGSTADVLKITTDALVADSEVFRIEADGETFSESGFTINANTYLIDGGITTGDANFQIIAGTGVDIAGHLELNFPSSTGSTAVCHDAGASLSDATLVDCASAPTADYAEMYPVETGITYGDIVVPGASSVTTTDGDTVAKLSKSNQPYQGPVVGIVSDNYGDFTSAGYNIEKADNPMPVALVGRVPVNVTNENGSIETGDYLTTSSTPGSAMKATSIGRVIGMALEDFNGTSGQVMVQVNNSWYMGDMISGDGTAVSIASDIQVEAPTDATSNTQTVDSYGLALRGNAWNGAESEAVEMLINTRVDGPDSYRLSFTGSDQAEVAYLTQDGVLNVSSDIVVGGRLYLSDRGQQQTDKYIFYDGSEGAGGDFVRTNASGWSSGSYDFAEMFPSKQSLKAGEVVAFNGDKESVSRTHEPYARSIAGIVSTQPGFLAGDNLPGSHPIALAGRVPTMVNAENGAIEVGDPLTSSSTPGYAMKATEAGPIVGYALEPHGSGTGSVMVFVNAGHWGGDTSTELPGTENTASGIGENVQVAQLNMSGDIYMTGNDILGIGRISGAGDAWEILRDGTVRTEGTLRTVIDSYQGDQVETIAVTSPETTITLSGTTSINGGSSEVLFEDVLAEYNDVISAQAPIRVLVTPTGPASLYVSEKSNNGFTVQRIGNETSEIEFDWMVIGYRKGFEPKEQPEDPLDQDALDPTGKNEEQGTDTADAGSTDGTTEETGETQTSTDGTTNNEEQTGGESTSEPTTTDTTSSQTGETSEQAPQDESTDTASDTTSTDQTETEDASTPNTVDQTNSDTTAPSSGTESTGDATDSSSSTEETTSPAEDSTSEEPSNQTDPSSSDPAEETNTTNETGATDTSTETATTETTTTDTTDMTDTTTDASATNTEQESTT